MSTRRRPASSARHGALAVILLLAAGACGHATAPARSSRPSNPALAGAPALPAPSARSAAGVLPNFSHMVVVVMENHEYDQIIGNPSAPYVNGLATTYGLARTSYGVRHPSLPNYLALTGGSTFGITNDCTSCHVAGSNLVDQLERHGISWKAYMEDMPSPCYTGASYRDYARKHDPFVYYDDIVGNPARCDRVVPFSQLSVDLQSGNLPRFVWVTPNLCNDMHDCSVSTGDDWLHTNLPPLLAALGQAGVLFLTFDEGTTDAGCCAKATGGHVATIVAGPTVIAHSESSIGYDHYSVLRTIEAAWGLARLRDAGCICTKTMSAFFS